MTKISINSSEVRKIVNTSMLNVEQHLLNAYTYCNRLIIPDEYVNKKYLNWFTDNIKTLKDSIYDIRDSLLQSSNTISRTIDGMKNDVSHLRKTEIKTRRGLGR